MSSKTKVGSKTSIAEDTRDKTEIEEAWYTEPDFIYGGPFISVKLPSAFLDTTTPINLELSGTFKKSFAFYTLSERLPVILTKIIDYMSRESSAIKSANNASDEDVKSFIQFIAKLKNDLVTNKPYDLFTVDTPDAKKWNKWIEDLDQNKYFFNTWLFSECYIYRRIREGCELTKGLKNFDYFENQKNQTFKEHEALMCLVADKVVNMLEKSDKDKRKADFVMLLKVCLWANKCDLSLSLGEKVNITDGEKKENTTIAPDPFQMILNLKDKLLVDHTSKIADQVVAKAEKKLATVENNKTPNMAKQKCSCERLAKIQGLPIHKPPESDLKKEEIKTEDLGTEEQSAEPKPVPCPAKMTVPRAVYFDIVCDNAGYELFADLCLAHFLIRQEIVQKIRFHVKNMPWFVSDVTPKDFQFVINSCMNSTYNKTTEPVITSDNLKKMAQEWNQYVQDGIFEVMADDYWTYPHSYKDMKKYDPDMYRKLQNATTILFKGDLNYRKLLAERNCNPYAGFEPSLQGFTPAPLIAIRTVKSDLICGLPKGKFDQLNKIDAKWMETGDYGVIQYCAKAEALKPSDRPCADYGTTCFGTVCPEVK